MKKIVVNRCYGGFGISTEAEDLYAKKKGFKLYRYIRKGDYKSNIYNKVSNVSEKEYSVITLTKDHGKELIYTNSEEQKKDWWYYGDLKRDDPTLVEVVEELGTDKASGYLSSLSIVEIPDDIVWYIEDYDGVETVHEAHQSW